MDNLNGADEMTQPEKTIRELVVVDDVEKFIVSPPVLIIKTLISAIPVVGNFALDFCKGKFERFQKSKREEFEKIVLSNQELITSDMVEEIEYLVNLRRSLEAVDRLGTNDKVKFWANLIKNGYLSGDKIDNNDFEEIMQILDSLSYRQIQISVMLNCYEQKWRIEGEGENKLSLQETNWSFFEEEVKTSLGIEKDELVAIMTSISSTGVCIEVPMHLDYQGGVFYTTPLFEKMKRYIIDKTEGGV